LIGDFLLWQLFKAQFSFYPDLPRPLYLPTSLCLQQKNVGLPLVINIESNIIKICLFLMASTTFWQNKKFNEEKGIHISFELWNFIFKKKMRIACGKILRLFLVNDYGLFVNVIKMKWNSHLSTILAVRVFLKKLTSSLFVENSNRIVRGDTKL